MIKSLITLYLPTTPYIWIYMLQQVEYDPGAFYSWFKRWPDYRRVMRRKQLKLTSKAMGLLTLAYITVLLGLVRVALLVRGEHILTAVVTFLVIPFVVVLVLCAACWGGSMLLSASRRKILKSAKNKMQKTKAVKIAIVGSYGKTTMKELLATVLNEGMKVAATPGNNNVAISHARWVTNRLSGDEEVLVIEFGEYRPGDIAKMAEMFRPDKAVITGIAPNHLENYRDYNELKADLASIRQFVEPADLFVPDKTAKELNLKEGDFTEFNSSMVVGWKISNLVLGLEGIGFKMSKGKKSMSLHSELLGEHLVGPIALAAAIADDLGLTTKQIEAGVSKTTAFEHRMQPRNVSGAVIIDDTYNGSIEGMRAGLRLLSGLKARRKIYVTPGLVEQGSQNETVHTELGKLIAQANPDVVVLMDNSVCQIIKSSLKANGYENELRVETDPLKFYTNIQYEVAAGDIVMMQNDWTDNYN